MGSNDPIDLRETEGWREQDKNGEEDSEMERTQQDGQFGFPLTQIKGKRKEKAEQGALKWKGLDEDLMCAEYTKKQTFYSQKQHFQQKSLDTLLHLRHAQFKSS